MRLFVLLLVASLCDLGLSKFCYYGKYRDANAPVTNDVTIRHFDEERECTIFFGEDCSIRFEDTKYGVVGLPYVDEKEFTCSSDGCNYEIQNFVNQAKDKNGNLAKCNYTTESVEKAMIPTTKNLKCGINKIARAGGSATWEQLETAENRYHCTIEFSSNCGVNFVGYPATLSNLNKCHLNFRYGERRITCYCTEKDFCNTRIQYWLGEAQKLSSSDFDISNCQVGELSFQEGEAPNSPDSPGGNGNDAAGAGVTQKPFKSAGVVLSTSTVFVFILFRSL